MAIKATGQTTIIDVTDAYSVILTSEAFTFVGNTSGAPAGLKCATQAVAYCGSNQCTVVNVDQKAITCPTGISVAVENSGTASPTITFTTTATVTAACEAVIPVVVDNVTVNKKFSFAVAKTGQTGQTGAAGISVRGVTNYFLASASNTGVTTSTEGWTTTPQTTDTTKKYLWSYQVFTYSNNTTAKTTPAIIGTHGATGQTGAAGADAITVTITSSNGTVFKNNAGSTVLTAHVFKGSIEQTISDAGVVSGLGSIKWYKAGSTTALATAKTLTVSANDVDNTQAYTCQLEG